MTRFTRQDLNRLAADRILILDGAMGTMIQSYQLSEQDFRGDLLADHSLSLQGNNDLLCLTQPEIITEIHQGYLDAGADIITTNTFNGTSVSQSDYGTEHLVRDINFTAASLARAAADRATSANPQRPRLVAGSLAPTNRTCSISPDVNNPALRNITFTDLVTAYTEAAAALLDGGVDILMIETVFDPLNAKAAVFAVRNLLAKRDCLEVPVWVSGTITDASGRTLTGQTPEAFWISLAHADPTIFGLNCALGPEAMEPFIEEVAAVADTLVSAHPNAGLPNELGGYDQGPSAMAEILAGFCSRGLLNVVGGCCGTTAAHIAELAQAVAGMPPRVVPAAPSGTHLAGLEPLHINEDSLFVNVGERTNVAGSRRFARLIRENKLEEALDVARQQVQNGAQVIDVNMDDAMLDAAASMSAFLNVLATDPQISRVPVMVDSSNWDVIEAGLRCLQGKGLVNSLSLKDGETEFRRRARLARSYGAAIVVMAFDEQGQADTLSRRLEICHRAWRILVEEIGFPPVDIVFDPNVFAVATGIVEHDHYAADFIAACKAIKQEMPGALVSGGISNLSFSFRGNDAIRSAMHSVFLYHAIAAGLDMGIVNAGQLAVYAELNPQLCEVVEDVVLDRPAADPQGPTPTERLTALAQQSQKGTGLKDHEDVAWRQGNVTARLEYALLNGVSHYVAEDALEALAQLGNPLEVIEGPLMEGMNRVGELFGSGKMFLPQVIRSARVMKLAVDTLDPYLKKLGGPGKTHTGRVLLATVKGDVHDIGKNIVGVVLGCNNYEVIDLGVMVPAETIVQTALEKNVDFIGLSGLITPSLEEMVRVAERMSKVGLDVPLLIGGATTSRLHTAVKIAPHYEPGVIHVLDASRVVGVVGKLTQPESRQEFLATTRVEYGRLCDERRESGPGRNLLSLAEARNRAQKIDWSLHPPKRPRIVGRRHWRQLDLQELLPYIDWTPFFHAWRLKGKYPTILRDPQVGPEAQRLWDDARETLSDLMAGGDLEAAAAMGLFPAAADGDEVVIFHDETRQEIRARVPFLRQQRDSARGSSNLCLADFLAPRSSGIPDWIGAFVVTAGLGAGRLARAFQADSDDYQSILVKSLADRLAEALAEKLHQDVRREHWGYASDEQLDFEALIREEYQGIRPAPGYPACPDHLGKRFLFDLLDAEQAIGVVLTESCAMDPAASVAGWYFAHPDARYFGVGKIGKDQMVDYATRAGISPEEARRWLAPNLVD